MVKDLKTKAARAVSFVLHPQFIFPVALFLPFFKDGQVDDYFVVLGISFVLPFLYFLYLFFSKRISDWDIKDRKERYRIYAAALIGMLASLGYLYAFSSGLIFQDFLKLFLVAVVLVAANFVSKVSIHAACISFLCIFLVKDFWVSPFIFVLVPLVAASRYILKRHGILELILGATIPFLFLLF